MALGALIAGVNALLGERLNKGFLEDISYAVHEQRRSAAGLRASVLCKDIGVSPIGFEKTYSRQLGEWGGGRWPALIRECTFDDLA
jgi:hypothetical protein